MLVKRHRGQNVKFNDGDNDDDYDDDDDGMMMMMIMMRMMMMMIMMMMMMMVNPQIPHRTDSPNWGISLLGNVPRHVPQLT